MVGEWARKPTKVGYHDDYSADCRLLCVTGHVRRDQRELLDERAVEGR